MASTDPREYMGLAWELQHKYPSIGDNAAAWYARRDQRKQDMGRGRHTTTVPLLDEADSLAIRQCPASVREAADVARELLGDVVCDLLSSGASQRDVAELTGLSTTELSRRIGAARHAMAGLMNSK